MSLAFVLPLLVFLAPAPRYLQDNVTPKETAISLDVNAWTNSVQVKKLICKRGTPIEIQGMVRDAPKHFKFALKERQVIATGETGEDNTSWKLVWNTSELTEEVHRPFLYYAGDDNNWTPCARIMVEIVPDYPFEVSVNAPTNFQKEPVKCLVKSKCETPIENYILKVDGVTVKAVNNKDVYEIDMAHSPTGSHDISVVVVTTDQKIELAPVKIELPSRIIIKPLASKEIKAGAMQFLAVQTDEGLKLQSVAYFIDGAPYQTSTNSPFNDVSLVAKDLTDGVHYLYAVGTDADGAAYYSPRTLFKITGSEHKRKPEHGDDDIAPQFDSFEEWEIDFSERVSKLRTSLETISEQIRKEYFSSASVQESLKILIDEYNYHAKNRSLALHLRPPSKVSDENRHSLHKAIQDLASAHMEAYNAVNGVRSTLGSLRIWDGTLSNMPRAERSQYSSAMRQQSIKLRSAYALSVQAMQNADLASRRLNSP